MRPSQADGFAVAVVATFPDGTIDLYAARPLDDGRAVGLGLSAG